jgi:hypothetical protein
MPYKDPEKQREAQARWYANKLATGWAFKQAEAERKAAWLQTEEGKASNAAASKRHRRNKSNPKNSL